MITRPGKAGGGTDLLTLLNKVTDCSGRRKLHLAVRGDQAGTNSS